MTMELLVEHHIILSMKEDELSILCKQIEDF